ncbi:MAG TPA: hypothetical protein VN580_12970, partial [Clostridia bacterium]|nr:hypothetical protein [Clostridia bacterium]
TIVPVKSQPIFSTDIREKCLIPYFSILPAYPAFPNVLVSDTYLEKMVIDITLKVLQLQQVQIPKAEVREADENGDHTGGCEYNNNRICDYDWREESGTFRTNW